MFELINSPFDTREGDTMPVATSPNPVDTENGPAASPQTGRTRKPKHLASDGKPMHRLIFVVSGKDKDHILTAITSRIGPMFVRAFGGEKIAATGDPQEYQGRALAALLRGLAGWH